MSQVNNPTSSNTTEEGALASQGNSGLWRHVYKIAALSLLTLAAFAVVVVVSSTSYDHAQSAFSQKKIEDRRQTILKSGLKTTEGLRKGLSDPGFQRDYAGWKASFTAFLSNFRTLKSWDQPMVADAMGKLGDMTEQFKTLEAFLKKQTIATQAGAESPDKQQWITQQITDQIKTIQHDFDQLIPVMQKLVVENQKDVDHATSVIAEFENTAMLTLYVTLGGLFAVIVALHFFVGYRIAKPYAQIAMRLREMNEGNHTCPIAGTNRNDEFGEIARVLQAFRENAQRIDHLQKHLQQSIAEAKRSNQLKNQFFSRMTQELKAPLTAIVGYSDMIVQQQDGPLDLQRLRNDINHIANAGQNLLTMVDSVMELTDEGEGSLVKTESFNVLEEIQQVLPALEVDILKNRNKFKVSCPDTTVTMASDPQKIKKALIHLIKNAAQFTTQGQIILDITSARLGDMPAICFKIKDTGCGIDQSRLKTLFGAQEGLVPVGEGGATNGNMGLGLAIVKKITTDLHGLVGVESIPQQGSTFSMTLPCSYAEAHERAAKISLSPLAQAV